MKSLDKSKISEMIDSDKDKIKELIDDTVKKLYFMVNDEEYKIGGFIGDTQRIVYKILIIIKITIYAWLLFSFIFLPLIGKNDLFFYIDQTILFIYIFFDVSSLKIFGYSLSIYSIKRKWFLKYQKQLNLVINNRNIHQMIDQNEELHKQIKFLHQKIDYIVNVLKTPMDFLKTYQIIGFLSLIIPVLISLSQSIVLSIDVLSYLNSLISLIIIVLILFIFPRITFWKQKIFSRYRDILKENFNEMRRIQHRNTVVL